MDTTCFSHHLTNLFSGLRRGMINLSTNIIMTNSVLDIINTVRNIVRFSDENGLNPDLNSGIV